MQELAPLSKNSKKQNTKKSPELTKAVKKLGAADVLLFLGEDASYKAPECALKAIELMKKTGVSFTVLGNEPSSGYTMDFLVGAAAETKAVMEKCAAELSKYSMIIHCGGCMLNEREMKYRIKCAADASIPITNYGMTIAYVNGILKKSLEIFPEIESILN